jgi:radical SAM family RiPP maturation amino acid epimerase
MSNKNNTCNLDNSIRAIKNLCGSKSFKIEQSTEFDLTSISHIKRFMERWNADPYFRDYVAVAPKQAAHSYALEVDVEKIRPLWDSEFSHELVETEVNFPSLNKWHEFVDESKVNTLIKSIATCSSNIHYQAWQKRQIARTARQFRKYYHNGILHGPVCFELSKGCSVGCWFCGLSAARLENVFYYNLENEKLWCEVLEVTKEILGTAAAAGFCYWATDPLDNPDYEKFCCDNHTILGMFPQTTTAQPLKNPERTRSLLKLSREHGCPINRFSILSLKMLNQVHKEFSPEELTFVRLELRNTEADALANAGRAWQQSRRNAKYEDNVPELGTIACVTGFLINMVDRSVKLISPCNADEYWPLGYIVYDEGTFYNASDLKSLLERMIKDHMNLKLRPNDCIRFSRDLKYESLPDGFQLSTKFKTFRFRSEAFLKELGDIIQKGDKTAQEISFLFDMRGIAPAHTLDTLNKIFENGLLDDETKLKNFQKNL